MPNRRRLPIVAASPFASSPATVAWLCLAAAVVQAVASAGDPVKADGGAGAPAPQRVALRGTADLEGLEARLVQTIANNQGGVGRLDWFAPPLLRGPYLYLCCEQGIFYFRRDLETGGLALAGSVADVPQRLEDACPEARTWGGVDGRGCVGTFAGDRLYVAGRAGAGLAWYDIDARTGAPVERGVVPAPPCSHLVASPDQKHLYGRAVTGINVASPGVVWFRLDDDGRPVRAGEASGKGFVSDIWHVSRLLMTPDGRSLYFLSVADSAIAWVDRQPSGEIAYRGAASMEPVISVKESTNYFPALALSPDGGRVYAGGVRYGAAGSYGIFRRDPATGELAHQETVRVDPEKDPIPAVLSWKPVFLPDASSGFLGGWDVLMTFRVDRPTGRLERLASFPGLSGLDLVADLDRGLFYECHLLDGHAPNSGRLTAMRIGRDLGAAPASPAAESPPPPPPVKGVTLLQSLSAGDLGKRITRPLFNPVSACLHGGHLYESGEDGIMHFKQDDAGRLEFAGQLGVKKSIHSNRRICAAGGHLYGARARPGEGLAWYDLDPHTGAPTLREAPAGPAAFQVVASPDEKHLYVKVRTPEKADKLLWFRLGQDGRPEAAGELAGKGLGWTGHSDWPGLLQAAPDGRHLYAISAEDHAIACVARGPTGGIALEQSIDLKPLAPRDPGGYRYQWASLAVAPDGGRVYAALWNGRRCDNRLGVYRRDPASGALSLEAATDGERDALANCRGWSLAFAADGTPRFLGSQASPILALGAGPTGPLGEPAVIPETRLDDVRLVLLDARRKCLYGLSFGTIYTFKVE